MKLLSSLALLVLITSCAIGQKRNNQIEVKPYIRHDWYSEISYNYRGRYSTDYLTMQGTSYGIDVNYKIRARNKLNYKIGFGYLRYRFNKLHNVNSNFGESNARNIQYLSRGDLLVSTNKYAYNIIPINIGIEKLFKVNTDIDAFSAIELNNFFTYSQIYNIKLVNPTTHRTRDNRLFGHSIQLAFGLLKRHKNSSFAPTFSIPIYSTWQKDDAFDENENEKRSKWLKGFSLGIQYNFSIKNPTK